MKSKPIGVRFEEFWLTDGIEVGADSPQKVLNLFAAAYYKSIENKIVQIPPKIRETHKPLSAKPFVPIEQVPLKNERCNFIPKGKEELQKQIEAIHAEKIPKERDTVLGRKIWQREQDEKIRHLSTLIN